MPSPHTPLAVGEPAPDFTLLDQHGQEHTLSSWRGHKSVLVVFFPFAFSGVCTGELTGLRDRLGDFETDRSTLLAISCDPMYALRAYADQDAVFFPLLSDFWPHGAVTSSYGVLEERQGSPTRSSYVVDRDGTIRWSVHSPMGQTRDLGEHARQLSQVD